MTSLEDRVKWNRNIKVSPINFYKKHHAGLTRGELAKQDPSLYQKLWRDDLLESVPTKSNKSK